MGYKTLIGTIIIVVIASLILLLFVLGIPQELWRQYWPTAQPLPGEEAGVADVPLFPTGDPRLIGQLATSTPPEEGGNEPQISSRDARLRQISSRPVAGLARVNDAEGTTRILYIERATGHLYSAHGHDNPVRLSNTTFPRSFDFSAHQEGEETRLIIRYYKDNQIQNFTGHLERGVSLVSDSLGIQEEGGAVSEIKGLLLTDSLSQITIAPKTEKIFYLEQSGTETRGILADFDDQNRDVVFRSPLLEWNLSWTASSTPTIITKPSSSLAGVLLGVDLVNKRLNRIIGGIRGLAAQLSPNGQKVLYSGVDARGLYLAVYDTQTNAVASFANATIADKCHWSDNNTIVFCGIPARITESNLPENWYSGEVIFKDNIWRLNVATGQGEMLFNTELELGDGALDIVELTVSNDGKWLYFINKPDSTLWALDLKPAF